MALIRLEEFLIEVFDPLLWRWLLGFDLTRKECKPTAFSCKCSLCGSEPARCAAAWFQPVAIAMSKGHDYVTGTQFSTGDSVDARHCAWQAAPAMARKARSTEGKSVDVSEFVDEVRQLKEEVQVLRDVLSEIHEELQWAVRNTLLPSAAASPLRRITSMPLDPTAPDFAVRLNEVTPQDLPPESDGADSVGHTPPPPKDQQNLF